MSKGLEALNYLLEKQDNLEKYGASGSISVLKQRKCLNIIEKELKALEIIKKYPFVVNLDFRLNYNEQVDLVKEHIDQEEYDLLKEVLL